ncbi:DEAD/DEAH box helicase, partial [Streptomyces sp. SID5606]|nr:DEAD/DEAH box helicase [Streptomyces sp. SID5606]
MTAAPAERGRTVVADRAVRRIAERAAAEADLGGRRARVTDGTATVQGGRADVRVDVLLPYPAALGETGERVRGRMADRVAELSGLTVRTATVRVQALAADRAAPP